MGCCYLVRAFVSLLDVMHTVVRNHPKIAVQTALRSHPESSKLFHL